MLQCRCHRPTPGCDCLSRSRRKAQPVLSRRQFLQYCQGAAFALLPAGFLRPTLHSVFSQAKSVLPDGLQLHPQYRLKRGIEAVLRKVPAGFDEFVTEKYQDQISAILSQWSAELLQSPQDTTALERVMARSFTAGSLKSSQSRIVNETAPLKLWKVQYPQEANSGKEVFLSELREWLSAFSRLLTAEFQVVGIQTKSTPSRQAVKSVRLHTMVRVELLGTCAGFHREQRVGHWQLDWESNPSNELRLETFQFLDGARSQSSTPVFLDLASRVFGRNRSFANQLVPGTDHWRTLLDGASGIDIYGHNGVSAGDIDRDGLDDLYVCQPAGLPNLLFRNLGDGTFEDITESSGVGVLENTACALFADIDNDGRQDLIVVCTTGPLLFLNQGDGKFRLKPGAFHFANPPQGTFTGAAMADYDRDGWLDIYFCLYTYSQGTDQYRYPMPYFDAENGPPNFLLRNNRDATFDDITQQAGLNINNTRFSFCCAWGDYNGDLWPDLYVVNDFGRNNLYRNNGDGTFAGVARETGVEDVGAGMSAAWFDFDDDGRDDLYVADMWTAAGMRISMQENFQQRGNAETRALYQKHSMGSSLFRNCGEKFEDESARSGTAMGRWSWMSDSWDFNHDGYPDLYIANGMISGTSRDDLNSFFWRQVVANSRNDPRPSHEYEQGWNAINELIRSDHTWSGFERNVFYLNNRDGTFSDVSGIVGLDCIEDGRTFALGDFDQDGRLEVVLKNRNSPQLRYLKNVLPELPPVISFRLSGKESNRDAIGARITVETESGRQSRILRIGSGFLAQHTKEMFFGLGAAKSPVQATIQWPSGLSQKVHDLPINHRIWVKQGLPPSRMEPFAKPSSWPATATAPSTNETLPHSVETWLVRPVVAADLSLPGLAGQFETLSAHRGKPVLLHFWSASVAGVQKDLEEFELSHEEWTRKGLQLLTINVDGAQNKGESHAQLSFARHSFPILKASQDAIAAYNIIHRQLFDRHCDLSVPLSFLVDPAGYIVKIYQGSALKEQFRADFQSIPQNVSERLAKALPFAGVSESYNFERNYLSLGFVFFERGYLEQEGLFFQQALKDDPKSAEAFYGLGSTYLQQQKSNEARECFQRVLQLHASYPGTVPNAWNNLGILAAREGNTDLAIQQFQRALQIDPEQSVALQNLGSTHRHKK